MPARCGYSKLTDWQVQDNMDTAVSARIVRGDGAEFIVDETDWGALAFNGAAAPTYEVFSEKKAVGDGDLVTGQRVGPRDLEIRANAMNTSNNDLLRRQALAFFNPKQDYRIYLTYMGSTRWIAGTLAVFSCENQYIWNPQEFSALFLCADPYWNSMDDFGQDIAAETARWGFPYMDHPSYGTLVSLYNFSREVIFDYDGDVPSPFLAELTADDTVQNPKLVKDGRYIRILDTMQAGDKIVINFETARVTKNGVNILSKVDRSSSFTNALMNPGINEISYEADSGDNNLHVVLRYYKKYLGV